MRTIVLAVAALVAAGCVRTQTDPATGSTDLDIESPTKQGEDWDGRLTGQGIYSGVSGGTNANVVDGRTMVSVNIMGATPDAVHPWHIHEGKCGSGGPIVGDPMAYPPLRVGADGRAADNAEILVGLNEAKDYFVNVHASTTDLATIVACGDLDD